MLKIKIFDLIKKD